VCTWIGALSGNIELKPFKEGKFNGAVLVALASPRQWKKRLAKDKVKLKEPDTFLLSYGRLRHAVVFRARLMTPWSSFEWWLCLIPLFQKWIVWASPDCFLCGSVFGFELARARGCVCVCACVRACAMHACLRVCEHIPPCHPSFPFHGFGSLDVAFQRHAVSHPHPTHTSTIGH
jgi:hypothetical protein